MYTHNSTLPRAATILLDMVMAELSDPRPVRLSGHGLPVGAIDLIDHNLILCTTPVTLNADLFRDALARACITTRRDVVLIHTGFEPEVLDPVTVDLALRRLGGALVLERLSFMRLADGSLHLAPPKPDLYAQFVPSGLDVSLVMPWNTWDERSDGLTRAAAEIVRACRRTSA